MGYCMNFDLKAVLKVMWVGRKEIKLADLADLKGLLEVRSGRTETKHISPPSGQIATDGI
jgi:hypothetical protein